MRPLTRGRSWEEISERKRLLGCQGSYEVCGAEDFGSFGEQAVDQGIVKVNIEVGAAVGDHDDIVVGIAGFEHCGENDPTGRNAEQDKRFDLIGAKDNFEIRACKGADAVFCNDYV